MTALAWSAVCAPALAQAQAAPGAVESPALARAVEAAWERAVQSKDAEGRLARANSGVAAAGSPWAAPPAVELSHRSDRLLDNDGRRETEVGIVWPMWLPGQQSALRASARAELGVAELARAVARLRIAGEVRETAWTLLARDAERAVAEAQASSLRTLADDVDRRVKAGDLARADSLAARAELMESLSTLALAEQQADLARSQWRLLTGLEPIADASEGGSRMPVEHPEITLVGLASEHARTRLDLVRASRRDPPELMVRYRQEGPGRGLASENTVGLAVRVPFGTDDRNLPREAAALSDLTVAQAHERVTRERITTETGVAEAAVRSQARQLDAERSRTELLRERVRLIERSFRAGESPLPELLRALAAATRAEANLVRRRAELGRARARLDQSRGVMP